MSNLAKGTLDAVKGVAWLDGMRECWVDDAQVAQVFCAKLYAAGGEAPHVEVKVTQMGEETFG